MPDAMIPAGPEMNGLRTGQYAESIIGPLVPEALALVETLAAGTPAAERRFLLARLVLARRLSRLRVVSEVIEQKHQGRTFSKRGGVLAAAKAEAELLKGVEESLTRLGLDPAGAVKLGLTLAQGRTLVERLAAAARTP